MSKVFIIAEAGVNHNGDVGTALAMVDSAIDAGCDAIKFQTYCTEDLVTRDAPSAKYQLNNAGEQTQFDMLKRLELSHGEFEQIALKCRAGGIQFLSSPFSRGDIDFLDKLGVGMFKIPSGEITNLPYLECVAKKKKPVILSTGMADMAEIGGALDVLERAGTPRSAVTVLHCTTEYPAPFTDVNLSAMSSIRDEFGVQVGYSDHTQGIEIALAAVALGASAIEKHFTLDRTMCGPDHAASLQPDELRDLVAGIRHIEQALGDGIKRAMPSEEKNKIVARKSLVAARDIAKGEEFSVQNLDAKRPGGGISPMRYYEILGSRAKKNYKKDQMI